MVYLLFIKNVFFLILHDLHAKEKGRRLFSRANGRVGAIWG
jgi:hypothetical protein